MAAKSSLVRSVAVVFGGNMASSILGAVGGILVARFVGPEDMGRFRAFTIPLAYMTLLHAGTFDGLWRQIPFYLGTGERSKAERLAASAGAWNLVVATAVSGGFLCYAVVGAFQRDSYAVAGWVSQAVCAWGIFYGGYLGATYRTIHHFTSMARIQLTQAVLSFGLVALAPLIPFYALCVRSALPSMAATWLFHASRPMRVSHRLERAELAEVVKVGLPFSVWGGIYTSVWTATEGVLMLSLGGTTALGLFSAAVVIREAMNVLPAAAYQVMSPRVIEAFARDASVRNAAARSFAPTLWVTAIVMGGIAIASLLLDMIVPLAIPKYVQGLPLMKVCLWFAAVQATSLPLNALFAAGNAWTFGRGVLAGLAVFPLATYFLAPVLGGTMAVVVGSLLGRGARTVEAYVEIALIARRERCLAGVGRSARTASPEQ